MPIAETMLAGLVGTAVMTLLMTFIHRRRWANADMVRALGSLVTRRLEGALGVGLAIHATAGMAFAFPYAIALSQLGRHIGLQAALVSAILGLVHGIVVSYLLVAFVAIKHPIEKYREAGMEVAMAHVAGHVGYGFGVGATVAALHAYWPV
jgi:hypothetical protein